MRGAANVIKSTVIIFAVHLFLTVGSQEQETIPEWMTSSMSIQLSTTSRPPTGSGSLELTNHTNFYTDDYVHQTLLKFYKVIAKIDLRLAVLKSKYVYSLNVINTQKDFLLATIYEIINNQIEPLEWLGDFSKKCVEKHAGNLTSSDTIEEKIEECVNMAVGDFGNLLEEARSTRNELNTYYNEILRNELNECKNQNKNPSREYFECSYDKLKVAHRTTRENSKKFDAQYEAARCAFELCIKRAVDCSFSYTWEILNDMGVAVRLLEMCVHEKNSCTPCPSK